MNAIQRVCESIKIRLNNGFWKPGQRLPSLTELAELCDVSRTTMWKALAILQKDLLLNTRRGGAIVAGPLPKKVPEPLPAGYAWERLKEHIGKDVHLGYFQGECLPPMSKLAVRYGAGLETVRKALDGLAKEGHLVRRGRSWHRVHDRSHPRRTIVLISYGNKETGIFTAGDRIRELVENFERECLRLGFRSLCIGLDDHRSSSLIDILHETREVPALSGVIVSPWNTWEKTYWQRWVDLLGALVRRKVPVIAVDQMGDLSFPEALRQNRNFRVLRIAGIRAGEMVEEFLLRQGHTHVAYLAAYPDLDWVRKRHEGMVRHAGRYGGPNAQVEIFTPDTHADQTDMTLALMGMGPEKIRALYHERFSSDELADVLRRLKTVKSEHLAERLPFDPATGNIQSLANFMAALAGRKHEPKTYDEMLGFLLHVASVSASAIYLRPFLERVIRKSAASAWVCSDELMSTSAFHVLTKAGKRIPEDIAVVGFENWRYSHEHQLTAYDFNMNGMVQQALLMIMDDNVLRKTPAISEVDGFVVERRTTRR